VDVYSGDGLVWGGWTYWSDLAVAGTRPQEEEAYGWEYGPLDPEFVKSENEALHKYHPILSHFGFADWGRHKLMGQLEAFSAGIYLRYWVLAIVFGILPGIKTLNLVLASQRRRYRRSHGLCLVCGYDLRATPDRCPECGTVPPKPGVPPK
jgi:hypothetical protein